LQGVSLADSVGVKKSLSRDNSQAMGFSRKPHLLSELILTACVSLLKVHLCGSGVEVLQSWLSTFSALLLFFHSQLMFVFFMEPLVEGEI